MRQCDCRQRAGVTRFHCAPREGEWAVAAAPARAGSRLEAWARPSVRACARWPFKCKQEALGEAHARKGGREKGRKKSPPDH
ncbi:hypothetical protein chiPu_0013592 [Chiloscyllium punctatum]|uniref:Uncharacterized protein n=1 Tax=Chiloscyllium punctatum TaxID=137246 RepID=A0A401SXK0_CHIPU|nr:hypothetical protein [Chiloscyllium punctatum]